MQRLLAYVGFDTTVSLTIPSGSHTRAEVRFGGWCLDTDNTAHPIELLSTKVEFQPGQIAEITEGAWTGWLILYTGGLALPALKFQITLVGIPEC